ncbi:MAG TPA: DUF445 family protein [Fibrobacteria bacterium]|nr:DUF445 family protein [Fibrobacteria bacterium]HOX50353.1 DUF445 family protein [Fibrobacteria bacterium]
MIHSIWPFLLPPVVGALIGWGTNWLALKMLFRPVEPIRIGPWSIQGVIPRRQEALAINLGSMVERELVSHHDLARALTDPDLLESLKPVVAAEAKRFAEERLPGLHPMVAMFLTQGMKDKVAEMLAVELSGMIPRIAQGAGQALEDHVPVRDLVRAKVQAMSPRAMEEMLFSILAREFGFIEWSGAVLGGLVGLAQSGLMFLLR